MFKQRAHATHCTAYEFESDSESESESEYPFRSISAIGATT